MMNEKTPWRRSNVDLSDPFVTTSPYSLERYEETVQACIDEIEAFKKAGDPRQEEEIMISVVSKHSPCGVGECISMLESVCGSFVTGMSQSFVGKGKDCDFADETEAYEAMKKWQDSRPQEKGTAAKNISIAVKEEAYWTIRYKVAKHFSDGKGGAL